MLRLKHRTFQLSRLGPGWLLGATELCSQYRSLGHFVVQSKVRVCDVCSVQCVVCSVLCVVCGVLCVV